MGVVVGDAPHVDGEHDQVELLLVEPGVTEGRTQPARVGQTLEEEQTQADLPTLPQQISFATRK